MTDHLARRSAIKIVRTLLGLEWLAVAAAAPLLIFPTVRSHWTVVALAMLGLMWLLRWLVRGEPWPLTPFNTALLLFALMIPIAIWASAIPELTLPKAAGLILGLAVFRAVVYAVADRRAFLFALVGFCLLGLGIAGIGLFAAKWLDKVALLTAITSRIPRLIESLPGMPEGGIHPNEIAGAMVLYFPLAVALVGDRLGRRCRPRGWLLLGAAGLFLGVAGGVLLLTQSRSGWIGGAVGLLGLIALWGLTAQARWRRLVGAALPLLALGLVVTGLVIVGPRHAGEVLYRGGSGSQVEGVVGEMTLAGRVETWSRALYAIQDFPLTGCGLGTFRRVVHVLYPLFLLGPDYDVAHAHNIFLQTALDLGLPGLVAYLALLMVALSVCWRLARRGGRLLRSVACGLGAGLVGFHTYGLADAVALGAKPGLAFWFALALIASLERVGAQDLPTAETAGEGTTILDWLGRHRWLVAVVIGATMPIVAGGIYWAVRSPGAHRSSPGELSIRLPLYPAAQGADVRAEDPPADAGWTGPLEVATFTTTHPITDVVSFYTGALGDGGWETEIETGDGQSWGGIYTREDGRSVCLLNMFNMEGAVWTSIVCGDKTEPVALPGVSPLPTPTRTVVPDS